MLQCAGTDSACMYATGDGPPYASEVERMVRRSSALVTGLLDAHVVLSCPMERREGRLHTAVNCCMLKGGAIVEKMANSCAVLIPDSIVSDCLCVRNHRVSL